MDDRWFQQPMEIIQMWWIRLSNAALACLEYSHLVLIVCFILRSNNVARDIFAFLFCLCLPGASVSIYSKHLLTNYLCNKGWSSKSFFDLFSRRSIVLYAQSKFSLCDQFDWLNISWNILFPVWSFQSCVDF